MNGLRRTGQHLTLYTSISLVRSNREVINNGDVSMTNAEFNREQDDAL